jgi:hypothetical protein
MNKNKLTTQERRELMPELVTASATLRLTGEDKRSVFIVGNVLPSISAGTAAGFVDAVEKLYNNGKCNANLRITTNLIR